MDQVPLEAAGTLHVGDIADGRQADVDRIINVSMEETDHPYSIHIPLHDDRSVKEAQFRGAVSLAEQHLAQGDEVLVHCASGVNRGPSTAAGAICRLEDVEADQAIERIQEERPVADPIQRFRDIIERDKEGEPITEAIPDETLWNRVKRHLVAVKRNGYLARRKILEKL